MCRILFFCVVVLILFSCDDRNERINSTDSQQTHIPISNEGRSMRCDAAKSQLLSFFAYSFKEQVVDSLSENEVATVKLNVSDLTENFGDEAKTMLLNKIKRVDRDSIYTFYESIDSVRASSQLLFDRSFKLIQLSNRTEPFAILKVKLLYVSEQCNRAVVLVDEHINPEWGSVKFYELYLDKGEEWKITGQRTVVLN